MAAENKETEEIRKPEPIQVSADLINDFMLSMRP